MSGFNLKSIKQVDSAMIAIKDPSGAPTGVVFEMAGPEHPERKRITLAQSRKFLKAFNKTGRGAPIEPEEAEIERKENLAAYTLGWSGFADDDGKPVPFSKQAALEMYNNPQMAWLVDQLDKAVTDIEVFITRSVKN